MFVAGKSIDRARRAMSMLRADGHGITFDWTKVKSSEDDEDLAAMCALAIKLADAVVLLWEPGQESARYEAGMALAWGKPLVVSTPPEESLYLTCSATRVSADPEVPDALRNATGGADVD